MWILPETCLGIFNIYFFKNISNCKMENVTTLSYCHWAMKITALIITYRQCFNFVMTLLHRMVYSVQFWRPSFSWRLSASLHLTLPTKQTHTTILCWKSLSHINIHFTFEPTDNIFLTTFNPFTLRSYYYFSLLFVAQFLWYLFREFGIGSTNNPSILFSEILVACLLSMVLIMWGENLFWSLLGVKGLRL